MINGIIEDGKKDISKIISGNIDSYVDLCENQGAKLFIVGLFHYLFKRKFDFDYNYTDIDINNFDPVFIGKDDDRYIHYTTKIRVEEYSEIVTNCYKIIGVKFDLKSLIWDTVNNLVYKKVFSFIPNCFVEFSQNYRVDLAVICHVILDGNIFREIKIAIEFDEQGKVNFQNTLMAKGWEIINIRDESYRNGFSLDEIINVLRQIDTIVFNKKYNKNENSDESETKKVSEVFNIDDSFVQNYKTLILNKSIQVLTENQVKQLITYIWIFKNYRLSKHWQVNAFIDKNNLWNQFTEIRALNNHGYEQKIKGILPIYFRLVCEVLNIEADNGAPLIDSESY